MESNTATERVESESPMAKELAKNEQTVICASDGDSNTKNSKNPVTVSIVATESPKAKEETKNEYTTIGAVESNGNIDNSKNPVIVAAVVAAESPKAKVNANKKAKNEETTLGAGESNGDIDNRNNPVIVARVVTTESPAPKAKEEAKNEDTILDAGKSNGNIENIKNPVIVADVVAKESLKAKEEAKNDETIVESNGDNENIKKPVLVALVATTAEVASIVSPMKTAESLPEEMKPVKNDNKKKQKEVQVSNSKKPFVYYLNRAKRYINEFNEVELCGLGMAIPTVVTIAEILKRNGFAIQKGIMTSTVLSAQEDRKGRRIEKAKIEIVLRKAGKLNAINRVVTPKKSADLDDAWN